MTETLLQKEYEAKALSSCNDSLIIPSRLALDYIESCEKYDLAIIGIDGFYVEKKSVHPILDDIADFSDVTGSCWNEYKSECNNAARKVLLLMLEKGDSNGYEFILTDKNSFV